MEPINNSTSSIQTINAIEIKDGAALDSNAIKAKEGKFSKDKIIEDDGVVNHIAPQKATLSQVGSKSLSLGEITAHKVIAAESAFKMKAQVNESLPSTLDAFSKIEQESPGLSEKDWGVSIGEDNELVITQNDDALTKEEVDLIKQELTDSGVKNLMKDMADKLTSQLHNDRLGEAQISNNMGKYDVSRENLSDIVDFKEAFASTSKNQQSSQQVMDNIYSQIESKADDKFSAENQTILIYQP